MDAKGESLIRRDSCLGIKHECVLGPLRTVAFLAAVFRFALPVAGHRKGAEEDIVAFAIHH
jgi:hypothetical protein